MQQIKTAVAVFCIACISAELVAQLVGDTRGKQCIKAAAGLYILIAISNALPLLRAQSLDLALPQSQQADFGSAEDLIVQEAQQKLETQMEAQILAQTGWPASLQLTLAQTWAGRAGPLGRCWGSSGSLPPGWTMSQCKRGGSSPVRCR